MSFFCIFGNTIIRVTKCRNFIVGIVAVQSRVEIKTLSTFVQSFVCLGFFEITRNEVFHHNKTHSFISENCIQISIRFSGVTVFQRIPRSKSSDHIFFTTHFLCRGQNYSFSLISNKLLIDNIILSIFN